MERKYLVALVIVLALPGLLFAAKQPEGPMTEDGTAIITGGWGDDGQVPFRDWDDLGTVEQVVKEKFGFVMHDTPIPMEQTEVKLNTMIASGDLPDVLYRIPLEWAKEAGAEGVLWPISDHLNEMPNMKKVYDKYTTEWALGAMAPDDKVYTIPMIDRADLINGSHTFLMRISALGDYKFDHRVSHTPDEILDVLRALKRNLGFPPWINRFTFLSRLMSSFGSNYRMAYDFDAGKWHVGARDKNYEAAIRFAAQAYKEGLLHPDYLEMQRITDLGQQMMYEGRLGMQIERIHYVGSMAVIQLREPAREPFNEPKYDVQALVPPTINGQKVKINVASSVQHGRSAAIKATANHMDKIKKWLDWSYTEEGFLTNQYGVEGKTYKMVNGEPQLLIRFGTVNSNLQMDPNQYGGGPNGPTWHGMINTDPHYGFVRATSAAWNPEVQGLIKNQVNYLQASGQLMSVPYPNVPTCTPEEFDEVKNIQASLDTYTDENAHKFIQGLRPISEYGDFVKGLDQFGWQKLEEIYNAAQGRLDEKLASLK